MTIPTYPIEPRDGEVEHEFVQHFGRMFKNLVRQYMPEYPTTEQQHDLLAQMQDRTSCFAPYVWSGPKSDMPQGEVMVVDSKLTASQRDLYADNYAWLREQHWSDGAMAVVMKPKTNVVLGSYCPSKDLLDTEIAAARLGPTSENAS